MVHLQSSICGIRAWVELCCCLGCSVLGRGAEPPQFWVLLIWLEPGISHVTWVHYDATINVPCMFRLLDIARFALFAI